MLKIENLERSGTEDPKTCGVVVTGGGGGEEEEEEEEGYLRGTEPHVRKETESFLFSNILFCH